METRTLEDIDFDLLMLTADLNDWACEDDTHELGQSHHTPGTPAAFMLVNPCCGDRALLCQSRVEYLRNVPEITCTSCRKKWPPEKYRFIPLPPRGLT